MQTRLFRFPGHRDHPRLQPHHEGVESIGGAVAQGRYCAEQLGEWWVSEVIARQAGQEAIGIEERLWHGNNGGGRRWGWA